MVCLCWTVIGVVPLLRRFRGVCVFLVTIGVNLEAFGGRRLHGWREIICENLKRWYRGVDLLGRLVISEYTTTLCERHFPMQMGGKDIRHEHWNMDNLHFLQCGQDDYGYTLFTELNKASKSLLSLQVSFGPLTSSWPLTYLKGAAAAGVGTTRAAGAVLMTSSEKTANDTDGLFSVCLPAEASGGAAGLFSVCLPAQASGGAAGLFSVCLLAEASGGTAGLVFVAGMKALRLGSGSLNTLQTAQSKIGTWAPTYSPHIWL